MPVQTNLKNFFYPDGAVVGIDSTGSGSFTDIGAINSSIVNTLEWDENQFETANAGTTDKQIRNMRVSGGFTLINLDLAKIAQLGGGALELVTTAASPIATIPNQTIASGWTDNVKYPLIALTSSSDSTPLKLSSQPVLTSVTADPSGTPEVLVEDADYVVMADASTTSGWSIQFISSAFGTASEGDEIEIVWGTNTPVGSETLHAGTSTQVLTAYAMQITHTDDNSKIRRVTLYSVDTSSGGFVFNFKGANEDGLEEMPITYNAKLDTTLTDGRQLLSFTVEAGAA